MKLLDTTFLIHYWGGRESVKAYLETHERCEFVTTTINIKEIAVGRALQNSLDSFEIRSAFDWLTICPFTAEHAFIAGKLEKNLHRNESVNSDKINALAGDVLIAAVAKEMDATVVTQNVGDFAIFDGVSVETY
ncbi:PIN domain-containing protein [Halalkalirubrum salinum]|uniref:PIN domain-containing protein n=1 Tax=Halalkalirubrum salinum TaxID=2563889 RepID=UPI0010FB8086|nr:PIN domain-containing protein [Halalkalirubrum salinum]